MTDRASLRAQVQEAEDALAALCEQLEDEGDTRVGADGHVADTHWDEGRLAPRIHALTERYKSLLAQAREMV